MPKFTLRQEMTKRAGLIKLYLHLQGQLRLVRRRLMELPRTGHYRPQVQLYLCDKCGEPFSARDLRVHTPRCEGKR